MYVPSGLGDQHKQDDVDDDLRDAPAHGPSRPCLKPLRAQERVEQVDDQGERDDAEDQVQETFTQALLKPRSHTGEGDARPEEGENDQQIGKISHDYPTRRRSAPPPNPINRR